MVEKGYVRKDTRGCRGFGMASPFFKISAIHAELRKICRRQTRKREAGRSKMSHSGGTAKGRGQESSGPSGGHPVGEGRRRPGSRSERGPDWTIFL